MTIMDVTHGQLEEVKRLAKDVGVGREQFQSKVLDSGILAELFRKIGNSEVKPELKIWKTIRLGMHKTPQAYREVLESNGFRIGTYANQILDKVTVAETEAEVDLGVLTVAELGFKRTTRYDAICKRIVKIGGLLCPDEVGPALRKQYPDQPYGEWDVIAMEALAGSDGGLSVFLVDHGFGGRWLSAFYGGPEGLFRPGFRFVFVVPRK